MTGVRKQTQRSGNLAKGAHTAVRGDLALAELVASVQSCPYHGMCSAPQGSGLQCTLGPACSPVT